MNASISPEVLKVQKFGRIARVCCLVVMASVALGTILLVVARAKGVPIDLGPYRVLNDQLPPILRAYVLVCFAMVLAIVFTGLFNLYGLFSNFARGEIYTAANVRHIRQLGLLALAWAVLQIVAPVGSIILLQAGFVDPAVVVKTPRLVFGTANAPSFITAGLILLASWIMEVGRKTQDEAERMRREAELVV
ncbi:MAG: DUF2975 domain-containing protein [Steroidobacteraceae bacterium]|nr:DUF2975 domain-containing protein [Steroidobacteraceae bacterium]